jgi:nicotinate-nucleotide pyrophosphorylase (carboxylating)
MFILLRKGESKSLNHFVLDDILRNALMEDIGRGDITTEWIVPPSVMARAVIVTKGSGVVCGVEVAQRLFRMLDDTLDIQVMIDDGVEIVAGDVLIKLEGSARTILIGERVALNFLQHLSGIATLTRRIVRAASIYDVEVLDTRKTIPGMRALQKYAVRVGGGVNHRYCLDDAVLIKDNHIRIAGSIREAVERVRGNGSHIPRIEVETETLDQVREAVACGVDIIMLDNMSFDMMKEAVKIIGSSSLVEASGGVNEDNVRQFAETGVRFVSMGSLTHSSRALDISLDVMNTWESL